MKLDMPVPFGKLLWFQEKLGLTEHDLKLFSTYRHILIQKKEEFADKLYSRPLFLIQGLWHGFRPSHCPARCQAKPGRYLSGACSRRRDKVRGSAPYP